MENLPEREDKPLGAYGTPGDADDTAHHPTRQELPGTDPDEYAKQAAILHYAQERIRRALHQPIIVVAVAVVLFILLFVRAYLVPSESMHPTLIEGDRIFTTACYFPNGHSFAVGDIACFTEESTGIVYVKRIIACGGDTVEITGERVYVNGELSPYQGTGGIMLATRIHLADDEYWVMGDNRGNSQDSRFIGPVKARNMISKVWCVYWPPNRLSWLG